MLLGCVVNKIKRKIQLTIPPILPTAKAPAIAHFNISFLGSCGGGGGHDFCEFNFSAS